MGFKKDSPYKNWTPDPEPLYPQDKDEIKIQNNTPCLDTLNHSKGSREEALSGGQTPGQTNVTALTVGRVLLEETPWLNMGMVPGYLRMSLSSFPLWPYGNLLFSAFYS